MSADFLDILSKPAHEIERPKPRPAGSYLASIVGMPDQVERKENRILEFKVKLIAAQSDVDTDQLEAQPDISSWAPIRYSVFVNDLYPLKRFLTEVLEIDPGTEDDAKSFSQMIAEAPGRQLIAVVSHRHYTGNDGQPATQAEIKQVAKA